VLLFKPSSESVVKAGRGGVGPHRLDLKSLRVQIPSIFVNDTRTKPIYPFAEVARIVRAPSSTVRTWFPKHSGKPLNFLELVEAYTIQTLRSRHKLSMQAIRKALSYLRRETGHPYPLAQVGGLETDGSELFVTEVSRLVSATAQGQLAMREILGKFLERVDHDNAGLATRFYPFTRDFRVDGPSLIVVDPELNFGRPCVASRAISTAMIARRYKAGESLRELSDDYGCAPEEIDEAIRAELDPIPRAA
jgi:uncharacterized protein (DUF433 family)